MKLQLALDDVSFDDAIGLVEAVQGWVDIVEVGTPFIIEEGMRPVRALRQRFPSLEILADTKIMDAGAYEAGQAFAAGADYVTVLGVTDLLTVQGCLDAAKRYERAVVVDMICVTDAAQRIAQLEAAGASALAVHTGVDQQAAGRTPLDDLALFRSVATVSTISVAGGIGIDDVARCSALGADVIVVGGGICHAADPVATAKAFHSAIRALSGDKP